MNEYDRNRDFDQTQPIPRPGEGGDETARGAAASQAGQPGQPGPGATPEHGEADHRHRYGYAEPQDTAVYDTATWGTGSPPPYFPAQGPYGSPERPKRSGALTAGVLVGALVLGGLAGLAGAATYDLIDSQGSSTSENRASTQTSVVERPDTPAEPGSAQAVADSVLPSVVKINVQGPQGQGSGSGVIISVEGEILTNYHVVEVAEQGGRVSVAFNDGTTTTADVVGTDPMTDLAVIKADDASGLTSAPLGKSANLDVGEQVVAIGSPFGLDATVTSGIVSALHRPVSVGDQSGGMDTTYPAIQTDAAINPGNSGGPLVNMQGEVVGINSSIRTSSSSMGQGGSIGLGFAIPLDEVLPIVDQLRNGETPTHARLGVQVTDAESQDGLLSGAGIAEVTSGSAADEAGLEQGDVVIRVDDRPITDASSLVATVRGHRPGDTVTLTVVRDDEQVEIQATLDSDEGEPAS
ncbi:MAG TPA: trypsin-like peptidase domain-containing protein [Nocardioidaceae bacterium]|nr:trypsin-like peptidase domain-containing protein [Nocardioidaceae bacterium]